MPTVCLGFHDWKFISLSGATPAFGWGGTRAMVQCALAPADEPAAWTAALQVLDQLAHHHSPLKGWLQQAQAITGRCRLLLNGWQALQAAFGMHAYPVDLVEQESRRAGTQRADNPAILIPQGNRLFTLHTACPYGEFVRLGLQLTGAWLSWSHAIMQQGRLELRQQQLRRWCAAFDQLTIRLPSASVMALHQHLWQQGITWQWLGDDQTRIGEGSRQRIVTGGAPDVALHDPEAWRVPTYTVTGSVGKTTTVRLLGQLLRHSGQTLALTASDGAWIGEQRVVEGDCIGGISARALLQRTEIQAALFEQGRGGIVKQGVPYARSDVAILLNVQAVHLGLDGIDTLERMADTKAVGLRPARWWVLNHDDAQCRRLAAQHSVAATLWFSVTASQDALQALSHTAKAAVGVARSNAGDAISEPQAITVWQEGVRTQRWSLQGVAPFHGMLGDKTLEELLAAVTAVYFGPLKLHNDEITGTDWPSRLRALRLDASNHAFRTSVHRQGNTVFVLDKAGEQASLQMLQQAVEHLAQREGCTHRIVALARSAAEPPERHLESAAALHGFMDEFVCFDRPDTYTNQAALPIYVPGTIPRLVRDELLRLNTEQNTDKPATLCEDWAQAEAYLRQRLTELPGKTLVLLNQPATAASELNRRILAFATDGLTRLNAPVTASLCPAASEATR